MNDITVVPEGPFFVARFEAEPGGVDFLGLRQVNLDMMATCLPGINNFTRYVRCFSVISWLYWKFYDEAERNGIEEPDKELLKKFQEKVETLFAWGHREFDMAGVPGVSSIPPKTTSNVELSFDAWKRNSSNTSLMAAPNYGPASKNTGGLGFVAPVKDIFYKVCGNGVELAKSLDSCLRKQQSYDELVSFESFYGNEELAKDLFTAWNVGHPSEGEKQAFRASFFGLSSTTDTSKSTQRIATIGLIRELLLAADGPLTEKQIRQAMAYGRLPQGNPLSFEKTSQLTSLRWLVLQVRQAQRLALECLFSWLEDRLLGFGERASEREIGTLVHTALKEIDNHSDTFAGGKDCDQIQELLFGVTDDLQVFIDEARKNEDLCIFALMEQLLAQLNKKEAILPHALRLLFLCSKYVDLLSDKQEIVRLLKHGQIARISLWHWNQTLKKLEQGTIEQLLSYIFENFLISQHFGVAVSRFDGNSQRLRISLEEEGIVSLVPAALKPDIGRDRLYMALRLMADCDIIKSEDDFFYLDKEILDHKT